MPSSATTGNHTTTKRARTWRLALVTAAVAGGARCTGSVTKSDGSPPDADTTAPTALATPASGSTIGLTTNIRIEFSEPIANDSLLVGGSMAAEADISLESDEQVLLVTPQSIWAEAPGRLLTIDGADRAGNAMTQLVLWYSIDGVSPSALASPASGSTLNATRPVVITFSEPMAPDTLVLAGDMGAEAGTAWSNGDTTLTVAPTTSWQAGSTRSLVVDGADPHGNALSQMSLLYAVDALSPSAWASPASGATLGPDQEIVVTFSEPMDPATLSLGGAMATEARSSLADQGQTLTLEPASAWTGGPTRTLSVNASDLAGNELVPLVLSYTVDATAPVATVLPVDGATIGPSSIIMLTLDEPVEPMTLALSGDMATEARAVWSNGNRSLDIAPASVWSGGSRSLVVDAEDEFGNAMVQLSLSYTVDATGPAATFVPPAPGNVGDSETIVVTFDEAVG